MKINNDVFNLPTDDFLEVLGLDRLDESFINKTQINSSLILNLMTIEGAQFYLLNQSGKCCLVYKQNIENKYYDYEIIWFRCKLDRENKIILTQPINFESVLNEFCNVENNQLLFYLDLFTKKRFFK